LLPAQSFNFHLSNLEVFGCIADLNFNIMTVLNQHLFIVTKAGLAISELSELFFHSKSHFFVRLELSLKVGKLVLLIDSLVADLLLSVKVKSALCERQNVVERNAFTLVCMYLALYSSI
jgi:hypothetical protein